MDEKELILSTIETMTRAFNQGDIDGIMRTYEAGAVVVGQPGAAVSGESALRSMFAGFIAAKAQFSFFGHEVVRAGELAVHVTRSHGANQPAPRPSHCNVDAAGCEKRHTAPHPFRGLERGRDMMTTTSCQKKASIFRMECRVSINIHAAPEKIWSLLTNAADFPRWNSTVTFGEKVRSEIATRSSSF